MNLVIGVTTCPLIRNGKVVGHRDTLPRTLQSILDAGWSRDDVTIFAEPESHVPDGWRVVRREKRLGPFGNLYRGMRQLLLEHPTADGQLWVEDDTWLAKGLRGELDQRGFPSERCGMLQVFRMSGRGKKWVKADALCESRQPNGYQKLKNKQFLWGANAILLPRAAIEYVLSLPLERGHSDSPDIKLSEFFIRSGKFELWCCNPSLAQTTSRVKSSAGHNVTRRMESDTFVDDVDKLRLPKIVMPVLIGDHEVTLITPTGGRADCFRLLERWISPQLNSRVQWIVVDDGATPTVPTLGQEYIRLEPRSGHTLCRNLLAAIPRVKASKILVIEDDDWYSPDYVKRMCQKLDHADVVGERAARYYNIAYARCRQFVEHRHASLCRTGFTANAYRMLAGIATRDNQSIDMQLWKEWSGSRNLFDSDDPWSVSIKAMPGRVGGTWDDRPDYTDDHRFDQLRRWTSSMVVDAYCQFALRRQAVVVYTAIFGGYDKLYQPLNPTSDARFVCFSDSSRSAMPWEVVCRPKTEPTNGRENRKYKLLPHRWFPEAEWTIYLDGAFQLKSDPYGVLTHLFREHSNGSMKEFYINRHNTKTTTTDEGKLVKRLRFAKGQDVDRQISEYTSNGFPDDVGAFACGFLVRRNTPKMREVGDEWWGQVQQFTGRDQLSLPFVLWKMQPDYCTLPHRARLRYARYHKHMKPRATV